MRNYACIDQPKKQESFALLASDVIVFQLVAGRITGKSSVWSRMARIFFQPIDASPFGLLPESDDNRGLDLCRISGKH